jgi:ABC-2 type transport system ATP-binding protein
MATSRRDASQIQSLIFSLRLPTAPGTILLSLMIGSVGEAAPMIEVQNLGKSYGPKAAVADVSFTVRPGEPTAYLGPNGAGKSTTLKILAGLLRPDQGQVRIAGFDIHQDPLEAKRRVGYVPENAALYATLTPNEYLSLIAELYHLDRPTAADRITQLLRAFDLPNVGDRQIETLSKGQRQKVLLIGAMLHNPDVLLLDEPLNGLDANAGLTFRRILEELAGQGKTILFCSHILEVIERICPRVILIDQGRIVADDTTANLRQRHAKGTLEAVFQQLTRPDEADEGAKAFVQALRTPPHTVSQG